MRIAVLVKQVPDTEEQRTLAMDTGRIDRDDSAAVLDQIDEVAVEIALQAKDNDTSVEVVVMSMGPQQARDALRTCLAMGADRAIHICDPSIAGADAMTTARILAAASRTCEPDLVLAGNESTDGRCGVVPSAIGELLGWPCLPAAESVTVGPDAVTAVMRSQDQELQVAAQLPAIVSVTERAAEARFATLRGILSAKRKPLEVVTLADLAVLTSAAPASVVRGVSERTARVAGQIIPDGADAVEQLVEFLAARRAIH